jgi:hypothetical protein
MSPLILSLFVVPVKSQMQPFTWNQMGCLLIEFES